jgi:hypothetical protein
MRSFVLSDFGFPFGQAMREWYSEYHSSVVMADNSNTEELMLLAAEKIQVLEAALAALEAATGVKRSSPAVRQAITKSLRSAGSGANRAADPGALITKMHGRSEAVAKRREAAAAEEAEFAKRREEVRKRRER